MPGATTLRLVDPCTPMFWNAKMMPHTVPNSPMNGVMLAVVARNGTRFSSLLTSALVARSSARSTASRLLKVGRGAPAAGLASPSGFFCAQLRVELGVAGLEDADERTLRDARADRLHLGELGALAEHLEKRPRVALGAAVLPDLVENDAPGDGGEEEQDEEDALRERRGARDELNEIHSAGPRVRRALRLEGEGHVSKRAQTKPPVAAEGAETLVAPLGQRS